MDNPAPSMAASDPAAVASPPGVDLVKLSAYLARELGTADDASLTVTLLDGGRSNLTYRVAVAEHVWVLRRPPLGHVMATAHDMVREYRVLEGLATSPVPTPRPVHLCEDRDILGAPFMLMEFVEGRAYRLAAEMEQLGEARTKAISEQLIDTLGALHRVDPAACGLDGIGRPAGFLERQVRRWARQLEASTSRPLRGAEELVVALQDSQPVSPAPAIVHGDFRLDNLLIDDADQAAAVIDWEMATLGDPLTDLALLLVYQSLDHIDPDRVPEASSAPGFLDQEQQLGRYAASTGIDLSAFPFYYALASFKLAVIVESVYFRHAQGLTVGEGFDNVGHLVEPVIAGGLNALKGS